MSSRGNTATSTFIKQEAGLTTTIKTEPGILKQERLSSFRLPRDLTLGGVSPARINRNAVNKKVYTPNLNATRNKNTDVKTSRDTTAIGRGRGRGERGRGAGAARGARGGAKNAALVQTSGLFSEGTGEQRLRKSSVFDRNSSSSDGASSLRRPTIVKREIKIDPEVERKQIQDILGDDDDDDMMNGTNGFANGDFTPISVHDIKSEIKTETKTENNSTEQIAKKLATKYPQSLEDFFTRQHPQLFLLQLPDSLPGHGPDDEIGESAAAEQAAASDDPSSKYCTVRQLDEGLIGTIVRYKSGRTKLLTGDTRFDLDLGMEPGLLQEVISVNTNARERSGNLINLGQINAKLSAIPDWEYIFANSSRPGSSTS